ncbi:hypothetical protein ABVK25_004519 [Lepraria finkii]|uniref:Uncharacterized protein n=1 Tax=Lepraria finkii TaxID=1340010 RepID=A0ABR4BBE6_9LECA
MDAATAKHGEQASLIAVSTGNNTMNVENNGGNSFNVFKNITVVTDKSGIVVGFTTLDGEHIGFKGNYPRAITMGADEKPNATAAVGPVFLPSARILTKSGRVVGLSAEIWCKIIGWAMTAAYGTVQLPCLTNQRYKPSVATSLLLVNYEFYREASKHLWKNTLIFQHYGSDIKPMVDALNLTSRRLNSSPAAEPVFQEVIFMIGGNGPAEFVEAKEHAFACALKALRKPFHVQHLTIIIKPYTFDGHWQRAESRLQSFVHCLSKVKVTKTFTLMGCDTHLEHDVRAFPKYLNMNVQPLDMIFNPRHLEPFPNGSFDYVDGNFACTYEPAKSVNEVVQGRGQYIQDPFTEYHEFKKTDEGIELYPF